ncbi:hypothetical protein [Sciscionella sediminilitoris]|uniref:hypothetical protein n=1 Tax=Sciscionella sediminilitoris TaxID=1445613 RepID=UPI0004DEF978|nr:hypothetical protein [Sciscionella sp. SE31]
MHLTITTIAGQLDYDVPNDELPAGYTTPEQIAHVFADAIDGNTNSRQIVQHTGTGTWTAINSEHVIAVEVSHVKAEPLPNESR